MDADFPFGFDFLTKVDFCEINFGERTEIGEKTTIAGVEMPRKGFTLCRICGKVQDGGKDKQKPAHAFTCTAKDQESDKHLLDCLYLYRQFVSEAIRILLPVSIISDSKRRLHSFIAAIQLGLKKRFKGRIDHLQTTVHEEPLPDSSFKRKYLVLYDTVPGGTGYLKQLMRSSDELMDILQLALEALKSCPCNQDGAKDGCYRCLYAYRNSYNMKETSRDTAVELLAEILSYKDRLVKTDTIDVAKHVDLGVGVVPVVNLEWIQKIHRDNKERGYSAEAIVDTILRRMPDYINYVTPQFSSTDVNFQRVATVDTSNPFIARDIPTPDESFVVIRYREPKQADFPYLLSMIPNSFMSRANTIVVPGSKMGYAMELILAPMIHKLIEGRGGK